MGYNQTIKTIDLSAFIEKTLDVKLLDGTTIQVKRPTKAIALKLQQLKEFDRNDEDEENVKEYRQLIVDILFSAFNNNIQKKEIPFDVINDMPDSMLISVTTEYFRFLHEVLSNPNSNSLSSPTKPKRQGKKHQK